MTALPAEAPTAQPAAPDGHAPYRPRPVRGYASGKEDYLRRLRKIEGQVRGLQKMIEGDAWCPDVVTQVARHPRPAGGRHRPAQRPPAALRHRRSGIAGGGRRAARRGHRHHPPGHPAVTHWAADLAASRHGADHGDGHHHDGDHHGGQDGAVTDPVCGMTVDPATAAARRGSGPETVYLCSEGCAAAYDAAQAGHATVAGQRIPGRSKRVLASRLQVPPRLHGAAAPDIRGYTAFLPAVP
jgi:YHS domain-containing protein